MAFTKTILSPLTSASAAQQFTARDDRMAIMGLHYVEGVAAVKGGDPRLALEVIQRGAGANWNVEIRSGWAIIDGDDAVNQGMYADYNDATAALLNATGAPATNPRLDLVVARVNDEEHTVRTPKNQIYFDFVYGTPTSGATLANRSGAAALSPSAIHLADVLVSPGSGSIQTAMISDKRKLYGPALWGENGTRYRIGVNASGQLGLEPV